MIAARSISVPGPHYWEVLGCRRADGNERAVLSSLDPTNLPHGMELDRTVYMRVEPFIILIDRWRRNGVEINLEQEKRTRVVLVVPVGNFQHTSTPSVQWTNPSSAKPSGRYSFSKRCSSQTRSGVR
jgi:hypothetical protein